MRSISRIVSFAILLILLLSFAACNVPMAPKEEPVILSERQQEFADMLMREKSKWEKYVNEAHGTLKCASLSLMTVDGATYLRGTYNTKRQSSPFSESFGGGVFLSYPVYFAIKKNSLEGRQTANITTALDVRGKVIGSVSLSGVESTEELQQKLEKLASYY